MSDDPTKLLQDDFAAVLKFLRRERDELRVKMHLAKAEAKEEWEELEEKWQHFHNKASHIGEAASEASQDVKAATGMLADELKHGYAKIKQAFKDET